MTEIKLGFGTMCRSCGEDIAQGELCYVQEHHIPFSEKSLSEQIDEGSIYCAKCVADIALNIKKVVKIDPEGRFIFFVPPDTKKEVIDDMSTTIREWWESGDKFLWALGDLTLVRLSDNGEAEVIFQGEEA